MERPEKCSCQLRPASKNAPAIASAERQSLALTVSALSAHPRSVRCDNSERNSQSRRDWYETKGKTTA